jgi:8-oxo-dGTP diphosphatase
MPADDAMPRPGALDATAPFAPAPQAERVPLDVAVGVLLDGSGTDAPFLLTSRPAGKVYAGYWEFPGGKLEPGESVVQALARELHEELGVHIDAGQTTRWREEIVDYPHARVRLHFCKVHAWAGAFEMREAQQMCWARLPVPVGPVLPGTVPVLRWLAAERGFEGATHQEPPGAERADADARRTGEGS